MELKRGQSEGKDTPADSVSPRRNTRGASSDKVITHLILMQRDATSVPLVARESLIRPVWWCPPRLLIAEETRMWPRRRRRVIPPTLQSSRMADDGTRDWRKAENHRDGSAASTYPHYHGLADSNTRWSIKQAAQRVRQVLSDIKALQILTNIHWSAQLLRPVPSLIQKF